MFVFIEPTILLGLCGLIAYGLFSGILLAVCRLLAEVIQTFPIFTKEQKLKGHIIYIC